MSAETLTASDTVVNDEINPTTTNTEQAEASTTNGLLHSNGTNNNTGTFETSTEGQVESTKNAYDDNGQGSFNKSDLEPESLRKVFIGGLSYKTDDQTFRDYFSKYGDIDVSEKQQKQKKRKLYFYFIRIVS
jgi:RNA recognition motif-containing protein